MLNLNSTVLESIFHSRGETQEWKSGLDYQSRASSLTPASEISRNHTNFENLLGDCKSTRSKIHFNKQFCVTHCALICAWHLCFYMWWYTSFSSTTSSFLLFPIAVEFSSTHYSEHPEFIDNCSRHWRHKISVDSDLKKSGWNKQERGV